MSRLNLPRPLPAFLIVAVSCCGTVSAQYKGAVPPPEKFAPGFQSITEADSEELLKVIAGEEFAGRGTGQEGYLKATRFVAEQLEASGFQPGGPEGSWFQPLAFIRADVKTDKSGFQAGEESLVEGDELGVSSYFGDFAGTQPLTFVKATSRPPQIDQGQMKGRILVIQSLSRIRPGNQFVEKSGADAVVVVTRASRVRTQTVFQQETTAGSTPMITMSPATANKLAAACGLSDAFFADTAPKSNLMVSSSAELTCRLSVSRESVDVPNVIGWYPGSDESLRHEHVCIGAHLDHLGVQQDKVYPGADDNGSGSTSILQIARAIHANPVKPKRSILLIAFCAEERGLLGSRFYAANPTHPISDMVCMLNIDMIGRNEEGPNETAEDNIDTIHLVGSKRISMDLHDLTMEANKCVNFVFEYDQEGVYTRSDHANFARQGVPITFLFGGFTPRYHQPSDTLEGINFEKIANCARLNYLTLMMAAEHGHFEKNGEDELRKRSGDAQ